jgi:hypothetical protein
LSAVRAGADFRAIIKDQLTGGDLESLLKTIEDIVDTVAGEPLNTAEIFGDAFLDSACQEAGRLRLAQISVSTGFQAEDRAPPGTAPLVFIASRLQSSGGHTAVLADLARRANCPVTVLVTGVGGPTNLVGIKHIFDGIDCLTFEFAPKRSRLKKLDWLLGRLLEIKPSNVWLFNHHQDSVSIAAVQPDQGYLLKYFHHGDHHLCLGVYLLFGEHFDPHPMGFHNCRDVLHKTGNRYLPLVIEDPGVPLESARPASSPLITCTAAGKNKIEHAYWPGYAEVVAELLAQTQGTHLHIGRLSLIYRWKIGRALTAAGVPSSAFKYVSHVKSVAAALHEGQVDLYLASFPYAGARTLVEVMAAGIPTAAHNHASKRFLGAIDMLPPGSCVWSRPGELLQFIRNNDRVELKMRGEAARLHYEAWHTPQRLQEALAGDRAPDDVPVSKFTYQADVLLQALERSWQFSFANLLRRRLRRYARKLRSRMS